MELTITLICVAASAALVFWCRHKLKQPADPLRPRLLPYNFIMLVASLLVLVSLAHLASVILGHPIAPRRVKGT